MLRFIPFVFVLLSAAAASAEPVVTEMRQFPRRIAAVEAADGGAFLLSNSAQVWFLEHQGRARPIPTPVRGSIEHIAYDPADGLLWGCTRQDLFATNATGGWVSWEITDEETLNTVQNCRVVPGPGTTTWVVQEQRSPQGYLLRVIGVDARGSEYELHQIPGVRIQTVASDGAGGLWAGIVRGASEAVAHFDGAHWQVWATDRMPFLDAFGDVFPLDAPTRLTHIWSDRRGGAVGLQNSPLAMVRFASTAPYPQITRAGIGCPEEGCALLGYAFDGLLHVVATYDEAERADLLSFDVTGALVGREAVPTPEWLAEPLNRGQVSARGGVQWLAFEKLLFRRDGETWRVWASRDTIEDARTAAGTRTSRTIGSIGSVMIAGLLVTMPPAFYDEEFGVPYSRPAVEALLGSIIGLPGHFVLSGGVPWVQDRVFQSFASTLVGSILSMGFPMTATVTIESAIDGGEDEPFPFGAAALGAASGLATGAVVDAILTAAGVESRLIRTVLWSAITSAGPPLGFHLARSRQLK